MENQQQQQDQNQINFTKVLQTDFSPSKGNALQACVASIFQQQSLEKVPNFIENPKGYLEGIKQFLEENNTNLNILKLPLNTKGEIQGNPQFNNDTICLIRGKSPRGDFAHVIVGKIDNQSQQPVPLFDPHPDSTNLDGFTDGKGWVLVFVQRNMPKLVLK